MTLFDPVSQPVPPSLVWINPERRSGYRPQYDGPFLDGVKATILRIAATRSGAAVLGALKREFTVITPKENFAKDGWGIPPRAAACTVQADGRAATAAGEPQRMSDGRPAMGHPVGSGAGSPSYIYFDLDRCRVHAVREDGVLIHELAHALRDVWGAHRRHPRLGLPLTRSYGYPNAEEFFAQLVMNMYLVERGRAPIVGYREWTYGLVRKRPLAGPAAEGRSARMRDAVENKVRLTEQQYLRKFIRLSTGMRGVLDQLASVRVPYNPFRDVDRPNATTYLPSSY